jgi:5-methylcytosine-specific restriction endonuclease McrA
MYMLGRSGRLDTTSQRFVEEVDAVVQRYAGGDPVEYHRRWSQLLRQARRRTRGSGKHRDVLRERVFTRQQRRCADCQKPFESSKYLHVHRLDTHHNHDPELDFGYFDENVVVLCSRCHELRGDESD